MPSITTTSLIDQGLELQKLGRDAEAEPIYREVLRIDENDPEALNLLGLILQNRGELAEAIALSEKAVRIDPGFADALANLGRAQRAAGMATEAAASARSAIALDPELAEAHLVLGRALLDLGDNAPAADACRIAMRLDPALVDAHSNLGTSLRRLGDFAGAVQAFSKAFALSPLDGTIASATGIAFSEMNEHQDAVRWHETAVALQPGDASAWSGLAVGLSRAQKIPEAIEACRKALEIAPDKANLWTLLGSDTAALGRFDEAAGYHERALRIDPSCTEARRELAAIGRLTQGTDEREKLSAVLRDTGHLVRDRIAAGFALGTEYDRLGEYDTAFEAFAFANRLARGMLEHEGKGFDRQGFREAMDWLIQHYTGGSIAAMMQWGNPSERPVFVVGMPRSGTTLVEQIASSHPLVHGAGERKDVPRILEIVSGGPRNVIPMNWDKAAIINETAAYIDRLQSLNPTAERIIDKLPDNVQGLGQISVLFPRARVIICRRDLRDVGLSCHVQRFAEGMPWTHDLADCAFRARQIDRIVAYWKTTVPLRMLEVHYEELVGDLEGQSRRLIDFLGMPWDPACLAFHENERSVMTASRWQVRQPLYTSSVGRWRNYRKHLGPLLDGLVGLVPED
jgi:tetratricopeptide (TPR) repeat protein